MMSVRRKAHNALRSFVQAYGTPAAKQRLWNAEFGRGRWKCLETTTGDRVYPYIEKFARRGSILDLGCGSGSTANEIDITAYSLYVGVDISDVALQQARDRTEENGRTNKTLFQHSDIAAYTPDRLFDVVLFRDSLYYLSRHAILPTLRRYTQFMKETGVFVVRIANGNAKYQPVVSLIEQNFAMVERGLFAHPPALVLVFRA